jgi:AcrR family transcriptional regulator
MVGVLKRRKYDGRTRASQAEVRREAVAAAATVEFMERAYEDVTLQSVADAAGVALKTVVRQFGTKEALFLECLKHRKVEEESLRKVDAGDVAGAIRILSDRYEALGESTMRYQRVEDRFATVAEMMTIARRFHFEWLARVFAPWMPERAPAEKKRRLAQLFTATELYSWWVLRTRLGVDRKACEDAMRATLDALIASWSKQEKTITKGGA